MLAVTTLSLALFSLALGLPTAETADHLESRQEGFRIGDPSSRINPSDPRICNPLILDQTGFCVIGGRILPPRAVVPTKTEKTKRQELTLPKDADQAKKDAIKRVELELQHLKAKKHLTPAEEAHVRALEFLLRELAGVTKQIPPPGGSTILIPGSVDGDGSGSATLLKARQRLTPPVRCDLLDELNLYSEEIAAFLSQFPPADRNRIWGMLITEIITQCHLSSTGGIVPDPVKTGAPIRPDPTRPGSPIRPDPIQTGSPLRPPRQ